MNVQSIYSFNRDVHKAFCIFKLFQKSKKDAWSRMFTFPHKQNVGGFWLLFTSENYSTYIDYLVSAMIWHNSSTHQQFVKFRTTCWIEGRPLGSSNGRLIEKYPLCKFARPLDWNTAVVWMQELLSTQRLIADNIVTKLEVETGILSKPYKLEIITETNYSLLNCKTFTAWTEFLKFKNKRECFQHGNEFLNKLINCRT